MLTALERQTLFDRLGTPTAGRRLVEKARENAPVRKVGSNGGNVVTHYASRKMGRLLGLESFHVEFPAAILYEFDKDVLEYYAQPVELDLFLANDVTKKSYRLQHFVDFLAVKRHGLFLEEWRQEHRLLKLLEKYPGRYVRDDAGWHFPKLEEYLSKLGITYRLRSDQELPRCRVENLKFLSDYLDAAHPQVEVGPLAAMSLLLKEEPVWNLVDFIYAGQVDPDGFSADDIYKAIADRQISFDLDGDALGDTDRARLYRDDETLAFQQRIEDTPTEPQVDRLDGSIEMGAKVIYEGSPYEVTLVGKDHVFLKGETGSAELGLELVTRLHDEGRLTIQNRPRPVTGLAETLTYPGPEQVAKIVQRMEWLEESEQMPGSAPVSKRTLQRWKKKFNSATGSVLDQHMALADGYARCGNRKRKIPEPVLDLIKFIVTTRYNTPTCPNKGAAYIELVAAMTPSVNKICQEIYSEAYTALALAVPEGTKPPSKRSFLKELETLKSDRGREGKRSAYQKAPIVDYLFRDEPLHGVRPFEQVHIDHTPLELLGRTPEERKSLGGIWLSLAIDAATRQWLAIYVSYEDPSYKSTMMVLRDLVRRHHRMPERLVLDNGPDFRSHQLKRLCLLCNCSIQYRPAGEPRHGSVLERLFGTIHTQLIHRLDGNTQAHHRHRLMTKSTRPEQFVEWTLIGLHGVIEHFLDRIYATENHPALGEPPVDFFNRKMIETGVRLIRRLPYNRTFMIETCPEPKDRPTRIVDSKRGVKVDYHWFWHQNLASANLDGKPIQVRVDPWDPRVVYVLFGKVWVECRSKLYRLLKKRTELELRYEMGNLKKRFSVRKKDMTPERLANWMKVYDVASFDPRLANQQSEARYLYESLGMAAIGHGAVAAAPGATREGEPPLPGACPMPDQAMKPSHPTRKQLQAAGTSSRLALTTPTPTQVTPAESDESEFYDLL